MNIKLQSKIWQWLHIALMLAVIINVFTGLRIAGVSHEWLLVLQPILPQGNVHVWHQIGAYLLLAVVFLYVIALLFGLTPRKTSRAFFAKLKWLGFGSLLLISATGVSLYFGWLVGNWHFYAAWLFIAYILLHSLAYVLLYGRHIIKLIFVHKSIGFAVGAVLLIALVTALLAWWHQSDTHLLKVKHIAIDEFIELDGMSHEAAWQSAQTITLKTSGGDNFVDGRTDIQVKMLENGVDAYLFVRWQDATESLDHLPLGKTENGWQVQEQGFYIFDESKYYEDKLAIMLANTCEFGGSNSTHLGKQPLADKPANWHGKGYHYRDDGQLNDMWHWKAVRTKDMGQMDDNYFGAPAPALAGSRRYTAGYQTDSKQSGAYVMNWNWYSPKGITPKRLPINKDDNYLQGQIPWFSAAPYQSENDTYQVGEKLSSVLYRSNQFEGDRGDVRAIGRWQDGYWQLEISRSLSTGSDKDINIEANICLWFSAFDHSQIGHTRHHRAVKLEFERE